MNLSPLKSNTILYLWHLVGSFA